MDLESIRQLIDLLDGTDVTEIVIEDDDRKLKLKRGHAPVLSSAPAVAMAAAPVASGAIGGAAPAGPSYDGHVVESPVVGTFYAAPSPDAAPFTDVGAKVTKGQTLCIVEAMKLMNEIDADVSGTVSQILVQNGEPVEFGQALFVITPA